MRCIRPGVPGIAHGRARVSGSRRYGQKSSPWLGSSANGTEMSGSASMSGSSHGSAPLATYPSVRMITGVRYFSAMRVASKATAKQWLGDCAAMIGTGASP